MNNEIKSKQYIINLLLTTVLGGVIGFLGMVFNIVIARYTDSYIFGIYSGALAVVYLLQIPAIAVQNIVTKSVAKYKDGDLSKFKVQAFLLFSIIGIGLGLIFQLLAPTISDISSLPSYVIPSLSITLAVSFISLIYRGILLGKEQVIKVNLIFLAETLVKFGVGILALRLDNSITLLVLANTIPTFISCLIVLPLIKTDKSKKSTIKINIKELLVMIVGFLLLSTPYTLDLILIPSTLRADYSALSLIGKIVYFASITVASVMFARISNQDQRREELRTLGITVLLTAIIGIATTLAIYLFKDLVIKFAFGDNYSNITSYFIPFGLSMSMYALVYILSNFFFAKNSYLYVIILLGTTILQVFLINKDITSLSVMVNRQTILYSVLMVLTGIYFIFNFLTNRNEKDKEVK